MNFQNFTLGNIVNAVNQILWGWPLIIFFLLVGLISSIYLFFPQIRYFIKAFKFVLFPEVSNSDANSNSDMTTFQAFLNALSTSVGNGSLAGMATAIHEGGPGAAFWIFVIGFFALPIRFCEVYLASSMGSPMLYLKAVPGGTWLAGFYAFACLMLGFISGNAAQANSICVGITSIIPINKYLVAFLMLLFVAYVLLGGAARVVKISSAIVPLKVGIFFISAFIVLAFNYANIFGALKLIFISAFNPQAIKGAIVGATMQMAIRFGMSRSLNATEIGLGTAAVFYGSTGNKDHVKNGIMSMVSAFISNYLVCFVLCLIIVVTGVWNSGLTSIALTTSAFSTVMGSSVAWLIALLSIIFGVGVLVSYAYIGRQCWSYLTNGKYLMVFNILYCILAFVGSIAKVQVIWDAVDIPNAFLVGINLYAILYLMPRIGNALKVYRQSSNG